ncbi:MAG: YjbQ family protein [Spirochaetales bacterium]|nr:YjbQ family protein [Spirochaetales bacterium]
MVYGKEISLQTQGYSDIHDITDQVKAIIAESGVEAGLVNVSAIGSTASITTIEYEPALVQDMRDQLERFASHNMHSRHSETWGDDNGFSHIRASFMGPGVTLPLAGGVPVLGTWQQLILIDHDNRPRQRRVYVQVMGE